MTSSTRAQLVGFLRGAAGGLRGSPSIKTVASLSAARLRSIIRTSGLFDRRHYLAQCNGEADASADPVGHYIAVGEAAGKRPNRMFDPAWYASRNVDAGKNINQLVHYIFVGAREGRAPGPHFDPAFYLATYPDVARAKIDPLRHYLANGCFEGRLARRGQAPATAGDWFGVTMRYDLGDFAVSSATDGGQPTSAHAAFASVSQFAATGSPAVLHVLHQGGGGTERRVADLVAKQSATDRSIILMAANVKNGLNGLILASGDRGALHSFSVGLSKVEQLASLLGRLNIGRGHLHQPLGLMEAVGDLFSSLGVPFDISIHDYSLLCPRSSFVTGAGQYCGEPDAAGCAACLQQLPRAQSSDIGRWRSLGLTLLDEAEQVFCPTLDAALRLRRYAPQARTVVVPYDVSEQRPPRRGPSADGRFRVVVIGTNSDHKGAGFLLDCVEVSASMAARIDWYIVGSFAGQSVRRAYGLKDKLEITGAYDSADVTMLVDQIDPDLIFFPQRCVETWSYALSEALETGRRILAPSLGAFPERLREMANSVLYDIELTPVDIVRRIEEILSSKSKTASVASNGNVS